MTANFRFNPFTDKLDLTGTGGGGGGGVSTLTGNSGGAILPDGGGNINIVGSGAVTVSGSGNTLTISSANPFFTWTVVTGNLMAVTGHGYFANGGSAIQVLLPATSAVGDVFQVYDLGGNGWIITQGTGQQCLVGNSATTSGLGGSITSGFVGDGIMLTCCVANTTWMCTQIQGNPVIA